ncbi:MAG: MFS transporter [Acidimicrobiia bacterium]|nr:MFS transporter [Acidimicrobiia bacterium]
MTAQEHAYERRWWILGVLCFSLMVITLDNTILNVALPTLVVELKATNSQLQWMVDSYTLVFAGLLLTAGLLGDRFGRRGALQIGLLVFGAGSLVSAFAGSANHLILTRALMGVGGAFIMPSTLSILTNVFPAGERGRAIGIWAGISGIGIALGPLAGGFLLEHYYWGSIFLVNVPIVVVAVVCAALIIPSSKDPAAPKLDILGAFLSIAGLTALLFAIIEAPGWGWTDPTIVAGFVVGAGLLGLFALWESHTDHPMLEVSFFKNPRFTAASAGITLVFFALFGATFLFTQYFQFVLEFSALSTGIRLLPMAMTIMVVAPLSAHFVERVGTKAVVSTGLLLVGVGLGLIVQITVDSSYLDFMWRMVVMAAGMGLVMAPATDSIMGSLPLAKAGVGSAVNDTTRQVGGALGVAIIGSVISSVYAGRVGDWFAGANIPTPTPEAASNLARGVDAAKNQLGGALEVAKRLGDVGLSQQATDLAHVAKVAFVDGLHAGVIVGAVAALIGAVVCLLWLPARARQESIAAQDAEYAAAGLGAPPAEGARLKVVGEDAHGAGPEVTTPAAGPGGSYGRTGRSGREESA